MSDTKNNTGDIGRNGNSKAIQWPAELELRDYFAAKAMQGMVPDMERMAEECARECATSYRTAFEDTADECARRAYAIADAMLRARKK